MHHTFNIPVCGEVLHINFYGLKDTIQCTLSYLTGIQIRVELHNHHVKGRIKAFDIRDDYAHSCRRTIP